MFLFLQTIPIFYMPGMYSVFYYRRLFSQRRKNKLFHRLVYVQSALLQHAVWKSMVHTIIRARNVWELYITSQLIRVDDGNILLLGFRWIDDILICIHQHTIGRLYLCVEALQEGRTVIVSSCLADLEV